MEIVAIFKEIGYNSNMITTEYGIWYSMKDRCYNPKNISYKNYGGRKITVCDEWNDSFKQFLKDMGKRPSKEYSIERIDNLIGYNKKNCKWILRKDQNKNKRNNVVFEKEISSDASKRLGGCRYLVRARLKLGWPIEKAFALPKNLIRGPSPKKYCIRGHDMASRIVRTRKDGRTENVCLFCERIRSTIYRHRLSS